MGSWSKMMSNVGKISIYMSGKDGQLRIDAAPAINPQRNLKQNPIQKGEKVFDYNRKTLIKLNDPMIARWTYGLHCYLFLGNSSILEAVDSENRSLNDIFTNRTKSGFSNNNGGDIIPDYAKANLSMNTYNNQTNLQLYVNSFSKNDQNKNARMVKFNLGLEDAADLYYFLRGYLEGRSTAGAVYSSFKFYMGDKSGNENQQNNNGYNNNQHQNGNSNNGSFNAPNYNQPQNPPAQPPTSNQTFNQPQNPPAQPPVNNQPQQPNNGGAPVQQNNSGLEEMDSFFN